MRQVALTLVVVAVVAGVMWIGAAATPPPYAPELEHAWLPDRDDIAETIRRLAAV